MGTVRTGTAGWAIPRAVAGAFPKEGSGLARYAARLDCVEINSTFYRSHRPATYARWCETVPPRFRFAVKMPRVITHERRLADCEGLLAGFAEEIGHLGDKLGPVLIQLPPSLSLDSDLAPRFFEQARRNFGGPLVCEPRHASWFTPEAEAIFRTAEVARVAADPAPIPGAAEPGGWNGLIYARLHGSPRIYRSSYDDAALAEWARRLGGSGERWIIFDNTASGAAAANALTMRGLSGN